MTAATPCVGAAAQSVASAALGRSRIQSQSLGTTDQEGRRGGEGLSIRSPFLCLFFFVRLSLFVFSIILPLFVFLCLLRSSILKCFSSCFSFFLALA